MSLIDQNIRIETPAGQDARARDSEGFVTIKASNEAVASYPWESIFTVAEEKLGEGNFTVHDTSRIVSVVKSECDAHFGGALPDE